MAAKTQKRKGYKPSDLTGAARSLATRGLPMLNPKSSGSGPYAVMMSATLSGVHSRIVVKRFKSERSARGFADRYREKLRRKSDPGWVTVEKTNPATRKNHHNEKAAIDSYREFHGREPNEILEFDQDVKFPGRTAALGELVKLKIKVPPGRLEGGRVVALSGFKGAILTRHPRELQLYIEGGDQSLDLEEFGVSEPHGLEYLGEITEVTYYTTKDHLGNEGGEANYVHKFGTNEETGEKTERPLANYDVANEQIVISGGGYTIPAEGIDG